MTTNLLNDASHCRQSGAVTLVTSLILLLLSSLVVYFTARNAINEQRLSANEVRTKQAYEAANAGLDYAMAYFAKGKDISALPTGAQLYLASTRPSYYQVRYCSLSTYATAAIPLCPAAHGTAMACTFPTSSEMRTPIIVACGWSDDDKAVIRMVQRASGTPSLAGSITAPVVTRGTSNLLTGGASVFNYFNDLTVWAGGGVPIQSNTGKTFIRNVANDPAPISPDYRTVGQSPGCNNPGTTHYTCSTDGNNLGPDVIVNDTALSNLSSADFFASFMGKTPDAYRDTVATYKVDLNNSITGEDSNSIASITGMTDSVIWVEGNASGLGNIGTADHPVVLVVNGDLDLGSNTVINGMVFVTGQITGNGTPTIYGSLIAGAANLTGNAKIIFDPNVLAGASRLGQAAPVPGGWRDW